MASDLKIFGPFNVPHDSNGTVKRVTAKHGSEFWKGSNVGILKTKQGCYVFASRAAKGYKPWYVGKAEKGFEGETFTSHKLNHYNNALFKTKKGNPVLFFIAPSGNKRKVPQGDLGHMEKELIQFALKRNPEVCNIQNTKNVPRWTIKGVVRSTPGKPNKKEQQFKKMMRIR